jgi:putative transposase
MPQSLAYNYIHFVTSTKYRQPLILPHIQDDLYAYLTGICKNLESPALQIGGVEDHIHILFTLSKKISLVTFVEELKRNSSKWMKQQGQEFENFYWQGGYGAFSVNPRETDVVINYIKNQKEHHKKKTFQDEYRAFLDQYNVPYDEKYVWD